jgi:D-glycero-D-manno-heptose 1,7-bisphosphate phosphatase
MIEQALILVGGKGTRLGAITAQTPKPLLEIAPGRVFLDYALTHLACEGVKQTILLAGHLGEQVEARYQGATLWGMKISVIREPEPAGTAGALLYAKDVLEPVFYMLNGDSLFKFPTRELGNVLGPDDMGALALRRVENASRYGAVTLENGRILAFREKDPSLTGSALINGGVYALRKTILAQIAASPCSIESDVFPALAIVGVLAGAEFDGYFLDIGLPDTLEQGRRELPGQFAGLL